MELEEKLFILDETYKKILLKHINNCKDLQSLRILDLSQTGAGPEDLTSFKQRQLNKQSHVAELVKIKSDSSR